MEKFRTSTYEYNIGNGKLKPIVRLNSLVQHAAHVFQQLPTDTATKVQSNQKQQFLNMLPAEFDRQTYLAVAQKLNIQPKTAEKQIARFAKTGLIHHYAHDKYRK